MNKFPILPVAAAIAMLGWTLVGSAGCHGTSAGQRDLMVDDLTAGERPVAMKGDGAFFDGKLVATATVSRGFNRGSKEGEPGGRGGRGGRGSRKDDDSTFGEVYSVGYGDSEAEQEEAMKDYVRLVQAQRAAGSPMPPVTLRVQLENRGTEPLEVAVTEVNSDLGNFAVRPDKLTIAAGATGALDPMISQLGVSSDEIPLKLTVRAAGRRESQTVIVKNILHAAVKK